MFIITLVDILHLCITPTPPTIPGLGEVYVKPSGSLSRWSGSDWIKPAASSKSTASSPAFKLAAALSQVANYHLRGHFLNPPAKENKKKAAWDGSPVTAYLSSGGIQMCPRKAGHDTHRKSSR